MTRFDGQILAFRKIFFVTFTNSEEKKNFIYYKCQQGPNASTTE